MGTCRFILNKDVKRDIKRGVGVLYCGQPTLKPGASYCGEHHARCHRASAPVDLVRQAAQIKRLQDRDPSAVPILRDR